MDMNLRISRDQLDQVLAHSAATPTQEVCGLLLGLSGNVQAVRVAENVAKDPSRQFELDPKTLLAVHREERSGGMRMIGHYHSHPSGDAFPSLRDAEAATGSGYWLIIGQGQARAFEAVENGPIHGVFASRKLDVID
jgi:proteasome lid subunit RPN8/RPN11